MTKAEKMARLLKEQEKHLRNLDINSYFKPIGDYEHIRYRLFYYMSVEKLLKLLLDCNEDYRVNILKAIERKLNVRK
jgi:hypothetical protein